MASQTMHPKTRQDLETLLNQWESRWRLRRLVLYLPRVFMLALLMGLLVGLFVGMLRLLAPVPMLLLVGIVVGATVLMLSSALSLWGKSGMEAARRFDALFGLQERLTTAFELLEGRIKTVDELAELQLADTQAHARRIEAHKFIHLEVRWLEWVGVLFILMFFIFGLGLSVLLNMQGEGMGEGTRTAINAAADTAGDVEELLATDNSLTDEERSALLDSTEATLAELENPDNTAEDAFAAMSELSAELQEQADLIQEDVNRNETSLQNTSEALASPDNMDFEPNADALAEQLGDWQSVLDTMSSQSQADLANQLEEAAEEAAEENPELAQDLQDAADALRNGDTQAAQEALSSAAQSANAASQENAARGETAENLENAAQESQAAASEIAASEYNENAQSEGQIDPNSTIEEQLGMEEPEIAGIEGAEGSGGSGDPSQGEAGELVESDDPNAQSANTAGQSENAGQGEDDTSGRGEQSEESGEGGGAGDGESSQSQQSGDGTVSEDDANTENNADGLGERDYETIFAPQIDPINAGTGNVELESSSESNETIEGEFQTNPTGTSNVPYNQVFSSYSEEANRALENSYVPLGVRDVVRDYFTSIEPTGGE